LRGKKFQVLRTTRHLDEVHYIVALPDETYTYLPSWMTQPQASLFSITKNPAVSLAALRRLKMIIDAIVQNLHDEKSPDHGGENVPNKTGSAVGIIHPDVHRTDQDPFKNDAQNHKSPGRLNSRRMAIAQDKPKRTTSASRRPR
jgi:hypothetical protein